MTKKTYLNDRDEQIFVSEGLQPGKWMAMRLGKNGLSKHRVKSPALPIRGNRDEAQADLDAYAAKRGWRVSENADD